MKSEGHNRYMEAMQCSVRCRCQWRWEDTDLEGPLALSPRSLLALFSNALLPCSASLDSRVLPQHQHHLSISTGRKQVCDTQEA